MNYLKKLFKTILIMTGVILIPLFIVSLLSYVGVSSKIISILKIIIMLSSFLIGGYMIGKSSSKRGYIEGLKLSMIFLLIITIFNYLGFGNTIKLKNLLYYSILIISCIFGSMIGINKKAN